MNLASISVGYLAARRVATLLNVVLLALAVAALTLLVLISGQLEERVYANARGIDLVVGPRQSAMQLILSNVYQLDAPEGAMAWSDAQAIASAPGVGKAIPVTAVDHYRGVPIVGTTLEYLAHYGARLRLGEIWHAPFEAVVGAEAAMRMQWQVGSTFTAAHRSADENELAHPAAYRVSGVLWPTGTVLDRLILTSLDTVWAQHPPVEPDDGLVTEPPIDEGRTVSALLIQYATPAAGPGILMRVNEVGTFEAAEPGPETTRLFGLVQVGARVVQAFAVLLVIAAGFSVFLALYSTLNERRYDLAIMRALGASPAQLMTLMLFEGALLAAMGTGLGLALGHGSTAALGFILRFQQAGVTGWTWDPAEVWIVVGALGVGMLAAFLPAWRAHQTDIARVLARG